MSEISNYDKVQNALKILNKKEINENDDSRSVCNTLSDGWMQENEGSGSGKSKTVQSEKSQIMEAVHIKEEALNEGAIASDQTDDNEEADVNDFEASIVSDDTGGGPDEDPKAEPKAEPKSNEGEGKGDDGGKGEGDGKGKEDGAGKGSNEGPSSDKNGGGDVDNYNNAQAATMVKALFDVILAAANEDLKAQVKVDNGAGGGNAGTGSTETEVTGLNNTNGAANQATPDANANSTDTSTQTTEEVPTETPEEKENN